MQTEKVILIVRGETGPDGTFGRMLLPGRTEALVSAEPPWKDNRENLSCIPPGTYECEINHSPHFGLCPEVLNVPGRTHVRMHAGNWAGDVELGRRSDSEACILPGMKRGILRPQGLPPQPAVLESGKALGEVMRAVCEGEPFVGARFHVDIVDATDVPNMGWQPERTKPEIAEVVDGTR